MRIATHTVELDLGVTPSTFASSRRVDLPATVALTFAAVCLVAGTAFAAPKAPFPFRNYNGTWNNVQNKTWGSAGSALLRKTPASYKDKKSKPGNKLGPNPRAVSNALAQQAYPAPNTRYLTDMFWQWGQFVDHDIDLTPGADPAESFDIKVPKGDPWFDPNKTGKVKFAFSRSKWLAGTGTSKKNPRQQVNDITSYIDASNVYGSSAERAHALRRNDGSGMLRTAHNGRFPMYNTPAFDNAGGTGDELFLCGDVRANEQVGLTALHTLFVREHNRIARRLRKYAPKWSGERIYQTSRLLVGAEIQIITYREFLPLLLGDYGPGAYTGYKSSVNAGITNVFSTAAYRFGHSMVSGTLWRLRRNGKPINAGHVPLRNAFFRPWRLVDEGGLEPIFRGLAKKVAQDADLLLVADLRSFLFGEPGAGGIDLASLNLQRGRDHGLAHYNKARRAYGLKKVKKFKQITKDKYIAKALQKAYKKLNRLDVWTAVLAEDHLPGAITGELGAAIMGDQFTRLRDGDRFWYQRALTPALARLLEKKATLSGVIARNTRIRPKELQPWSMTSNRRWKAPRLAAKTSSRRGHWFLKKLMTHKVVARALLTP